MMDSKRVALFIEFSRGFGRSLMKGISDYAAIFGPWTFYHTRFFYEYEHYSLRNLKSELFHLKKWGADGIIARELTSHTREEVLSMGIPTIFSTVFDKSLESNVGNIYVNNYEIGKMGAEHLIEKGFKNYAYCGLDEFFWSHERALGFVNTITKNNFNIFLFQQPQSKRERTWDIEQHILGEWLENLPKPIGLMACIDERSMDVIQACHQKKIRIPEDIALVGADNDELICQLSNPQLSSVAINGEKVGYQAAKLLDELMSAQKPQDTTIVIQPTHVVTRRSTDIFAIQDEDVIDALRYIHANTLKPVQVDNVANHVCMTRQALNKKFHNSIGRSIHSEITRLRINIARKLLIETNMSVSDIACKMNFSEIKSLSRLFKKETGLSPLQFRKENSL